MALESFAIQLFQENKIPGVKLVMQEHKLKWFPDTIIVTITQPEN